MSLKPKPSSKVAKTADAKNQAVKRKELKYEDKSAGQPEMVVIFEEIKKLLQPYAKASIKMTCSKPGQIILVSDKKVHITGKEMEGLWFASSLVQKGYVGFYYMPIYVEPGIRQLLSPLLLKHLKGKSCFHIKKFDKETFLQIKDALKIGYKKYKERGWV